MTTAQQDATDEDKSNNEDRLTPDTQNKVTMEDKELLMQFDNKQIVTAENKGDGFANNDGSIKETLDTVFHDKPGYIHNHSIAGSNRADYYEKRSQGMSDSEEEQDYVRNHQPD